VKTVLLWLWQAPQHLAALMLWGVLRLFKRLAKPYASPLHPNEIIVVWVSHFGLSLGEYIFVGIKDIEGKTIQHETGHTLQSRKLGPLYLPIVGLPSVCRNIYDRVAHKGSAWYYGGWPENDADKRAGVVRAFG
jgi:hypothetical protein